MTSWRSEPRLNVTPSHLTTYLQLLWLQNVLCKKLSKVLQLQFHHHQSRVILLPNHKVQTALTDHCTNQRSIHHFQLFVTTCTDERITEYYQSWTC